MRVYLFTLFILLGITAFAQPASNESTRANDQAAQGFTNKTEAKNTLQNGLKEGKWIEYLRLEDKGMILADSNSASFYRLTIYTDNMPSGTVRVYTTKGLLLSETPYSNGKRDGVSKAYGSRNGNLLYEDIYNNGQHAMTRFYNEDGKLQCVTTYSPNKEFVTKTYDEKGNEVKD
jgi:antitoxin component YwqK of YwqJK toxin-antitoxin module